MKIDMHDIETQQGRSGNTQQGVQVCSIHVHQAAGLVDDLGHFHDISLENPQRVWISDHQADRVFIRHGCHSFRVKRTFVRRLDFDHFASGKMDRGGIRAMRGIGNDYLIPVRFTIVIMKSLHQHQPGQFATRTCRRLQGDRIEPGNCLQGLPQLPHQLQRALYRRGRGKG